MIENYSSICTRYTYLPTPLINTQLPYFLVSFSLHIRRKEYYSPGRLQKDIVATRCNKCNMYRVFYVPVDFLQTPRVSRCILTLKYMYSWPARWAPAPRGKHSRKHFLAAAIHPAYRIAPWENQRLQNLFNFLRFILS